MKKLFWLFLLVGLATVSLSCTDQGVNPTSKVHEGEIVDDPVNLPEYEDEDDEPTELRDDWR